MPAPNPGPWGLQQHHERTQPMGWQKLCQVQRAGHSALLQQHPALRELQEQGQKELLKPCWLQTVRFPLLFQQLDGEGQQAARAVTCRGSSPRRLLKPLPTLQLLTELEARPDKRHPRSIWTRRHQQQGTDVVRDGCSEDLTMHVWATPGHSSHRTCPPAPAWHKVTHQNEGLLKRARKSTRGPARSHGKPGGQPAAKATAPMVIPPRGAVFSIFAHPWLQCPKAAPQSSAIAWVAPVAAVRDEQGQLCTSLNLLRSSWKTKEEKENPSLPLLEQQI
ncbi:hypothetical protein Anapl_17172 [Anas platyrhynchos]|uniref:Uncharacterized protein n=1 Tax=Anas platyrhynchos TaxID=8839 RepID=R0L2I6_ANAPL|nr:hypothetical protein Anapl_17172 [Anas platyrhynchos]